MCFLPQAYVKVLGHDFFKQLLIQNELIFMLYRDRIYLKWTQILEDIMTYFLPTKRHILM